VSEDEVVPPSEMVGCCWNIEVVDNPESVRGAIDVTSKLLIANEEKNYNRWSLLKCQSLYPSSSYSGLSFELRKFHLLSKWFLESFLRVLQLVRQLVRHVLLRKMFLLLHHFLCGSILFSQMIKF
jgi:hypothetical protein